MHKVATTYEILGTILSNDIGSATEQLINDPKDFISTKYGVDTGDMSIKVINNDDNAVNLALPYYSSLENAAQAVDTDELGDIAGGEIFIAAIVLASVGLVGATVAGGVVGHLDSEGKLPKK